MQAWGERVLGKCVGSWGGSQQIVATAFPSTRREEVAQLGLSGLAQLGVGVPHLRAGNPHPTALGGQAAKSSLPLHDGEWE